MKIEGSVVCFFFVWGRVVFASPQLHCIIFTEFILVLQSLVLHLYVSFNELQLHHELVLELIRIRITAH